MAKRYEMTRSDYESLNRKALWFNLVIMAIAAASIITLFLTNFWKVGVKFEMNESMLRDIFGEVSEDSEEADLLNKLDFSEFNDLAIEMSISIETDVLLTSIAEGGNATAEKLISSVVTDLSRQASDILSNVLKPLTKTIMATVLEEVKNQITTELGENFVDDLNLDGVEDIINMIIDGTTDEDLKVEIKSFIKNLLDETELNEADIETLMEDSENGINKMVDEVVDGMVETLGDSEGNISFNKVIINLAGEALGLDTENMSAEDMAKELAAYLVEQMPEEAISIIHYVMIGLAVLLLMPVVAWGLLFLFGFIRIFTKKKILYMGLARGFGIVPYILLVIIPFFGFMIVNAIIGAEGFMSGLSLKVSSVGLLVSFIGACVLALLKWCGYGRIKKRIKRAMITDDNFNDSPDKVSFSENFNNSYEGPGYNGNSDDFNSGNFNDFNSGNSDENFW